MTTINNVALLAGRILLSLIFITSGWAKITAYAGTVGYMEHMGVPGALLPLVILTELGGGLAIFLGFQTRIASIALFGFSLLTGYLFHYVAVTGADPMADMGNMINFWKNVSMAGGFLALFAAGAGAYAIDGKLVRDVLAPKTARA